MSDSKYVMLVSSCCKSQQIYFIVIVNMTEGTVNENELHRYANARRMHNQCNISQKYFFTVISLQMNTCTDYILRHLIYNISL